MLRAVTRAISVEAFKMRELWKKGCALSFLLLFILPYSPNSLAQQRNYTFTFDHLTVDQGLSNSTVHAMIEDRKGMVWLGTQFGLNRYDGYDFKVFLPHPNQKEGIRGHSIYSLLEDEQGDIWVGHQDRGISIYSSTTETFHSFPAATFPTIDWETISVRSIFQDSQGNIWIGTYGAGAVVLDQDRQPIMQLCSFCDSPNRRLSNDFIFDFEEDSRGNIWIGTAGNGVEVYDPSTDGLRLVKGDAQNRIEGFGRELSLDQAGDLWVGTPGNGLYQVALPEEKIVLHMEETAEEGVSHNMITDLQVDAEGNLWIATDGGGISCLHTPSQRWQQFHFSETHPGTLNTDALYDLMFDKKGNLWVGTFNAGLNVHYATPSPFVSNREYNREKDLGLRSVLAFSPEENGAVWMGTDGAGLFKLETTGNIVHIQPYRTAPDNIEPQVITSLASSLDGVLWIGTYGDGLYRLDQKRDVWKHFSHQDGVEGAISHNNVWDLVLDSLGGLWVGTLGGGLDYLAPGSEQFLPYQSMVPEGELPLSGVQIVDMLLDKSGRYLWVATENEGLNRLEINSLKVEQYKSITHDSLTISSNRLRCLFQDREGNIWIGTEYAGINKIDHALGTISRFSQQDGLPSDMINSMVQDEEGNLWISTQAGISRWNMNTHSFLNIGSDPYLENNQFNPNAALALADGRLVFGSTNGYAMVLPQAVPPPSSPPEVVLTALYLSDQLVGIGDHHGKEILTGPLNDAETIVQLSYKDRGLQILLSAAHAAQASQWGYQFRLRNYESQWRFLPPGERTLTYSGLPGGTYFLEVRTVGPQGGLGPVKQLALEVTPPFWQTIWFFMICVMSGILLFLGVGAYFLQRQKAVFNERNMLAEQEILRLKNENLEKDVTNQRSKLTASALQAAHKNDMLNQLKSKIKHLSSGESQAKDLSKVVREIDREIKQEDYWQQFQFVFDETHTEFIQKLDTIHSGLSDHEKRLCCFVKMGLSNREISSILNITINGVEQAKYRIKKKLQLEKKVSLNDYIRKV